MGPRKPYSEEVMINNRNALRSNLIFSFPKYGIIGNDQNSGNLGSDIDFPQPEKYVERPCTRKATALSQ